MNAILAAWRARAPRERLILGWAGAFVALALVVAFAWLPMERSRARLAKDLPALRASVAEMREQAARVKRLKSAPAKGSAAEPLAIPALVASAPFLRGLDGAKAAALDANRVRVTVDDAAWARVTAWIAGAEAEHRLAVESARFDALATVGRVRGEIVLSRS